MSRCKGKLDTGERCAIVAVPGKDLCTGCETRGAALYDKTVKAPAPLRAHGLKPAKRGRPSKKGEAPEHVAELAEHPANPAKPFSENNSTQGALAEQSITEPLHFAADGVCLTACGVVSSSRTLLTANWDAVTCENCLLWKQLNESPAVELDQVSADSFEPAWTRNDKRTQAILGLIGCTISLHLLGEQPDEQILAAEDYAGACHLQASDNDDVEIPPMPFFLKGTQTHAPEPQISPAAATPPKDQAEPCSKLSSPLAAVLVKLPPPVPPLPDTSIVIDLPREMFDDLVDKGVGTATIIELLDALFISGTYRLIRHAAE